MKKYVVSGVVLMVLFGSSMCVAYDISAPNYKTDPGCTGDTGQHLMVSANNGQPCNWPRYVAPQPAPVPSVPVVVPAPVPVVTPVPVAAPIVHTVKDPVPVKAPAVVVTPILTQAEPPVVVPPPVDFQPQIDSVKSDISHFKRNVVAGILLLVLVDIFSAFLIARRIR